MVGIGNSSPYILKKGNKKTKNKHKKGTGSVLHDTQLLYIIFFFFFFRENPNFSIYILLVCTDVKIGTND
jgi:hypothetical protein